MAKRPSKRPSEGPEIRILVVWKPHHGAKPESSAVLDYAAWLARTSPIRIQMVTTFVRPWPSTSIAKLGGKYKKWHSKETQACTDAARKSLSAVGIPEDYWADDVALFLDGTSEVALLAKAAKDFGASLILMSSADVTVKGRFLAGSTMESLLSSSPTLVGLMPESTKLSKRGVTRLTYGFIDGELDCDALRETAARAESWGLPLRIIAFAPDILDDSILLDPLTIQSEISVQWREHLFALLDRAKDEVAAAFPNLHIETDIGSGGNWAGAVDAVKWKKGDLLCLAASPMNPLERVFVGSATSHILQYAPVPAIVRPVAR